ncbi:MAG: hypothetical protein COY53_01995 [Elusimicrobia bacterium CG_4_10_14_0_8_um_filter_37_32]|nr:MAG: hypothetical protein COS17_07610 [Elusimicrobia bacterium CG02_land_8_20_14_3_00_37_13]PIZ13986.1 MAG: hypothetical protein COY53_01995 [Elusimicrobia bacterium CG_4_10_14_0_8_um_filter_37_32]
MNLRNHIQRKSKYYVYIVQTKNGYYYTGYTNNLEKRIKLHNSGHGAKYLRGKGPVRLVYYREYKYHKSALNEERRIKGLRKEQKIILVKEYEKRKY